MSYGLILSALIILFWARKGFSIYWLSIWVAMIWLPIIDGEHVGFYFRGAFGPISIGSWVLIFSAWVGFVFKLHFLGRNSINLLFALAALNLLLLIDLLGFIPWTPLIHYSTYQSPWIWMVVLLGLLLVRQWLLLVVLLSSQFFAMLPSNSVAQPLVLASDQWALIIVICWGCVWVFRMVQTALMSFTARIRAAKDLHKI